MDSFLNTDKGCGLRKDKFLLQLKNIKLKFLENEYFQLP